MLKKRSASMKTLPVSKAAMPATLNLCAKDTPPGGGTPSASPEKVLPPSSPSRLSPAKVASPRLMGQRSASLLVRAASFGRRRSAASPAEAVQLPVLLDRLQKSGGSSKERLKGVQELCSQLAALRSRGDAALTQARDAYTQCEQRRLMPWLLHPLAEGEQVDQRESPLLQASCACLTHLAELGSARALLDAPCAALLVRALCAGARAPQNQRSALLCVAKLVDEGGAVHLLRAAQLEPCLKPLAQSHDAALRVPARRALACCKEVPDSTLQVSLTTLSAALSARELGSVAAPPVSALHGVARCLGALSLQSADPSDQQEAVAALELCERSRLAPTLIWLAERGDPSGEGERAESPATDGSGSSFGGRAGDRAERLRLLQQQDAGEVPGLLLQLVLSCLANLTAVGGGACVYGHGGVDLMVRSCFGDAETQRFALAGLSNVCGHAESVARINASELPPLLRKLAKAHGIDKGVVPPAEAQRAAAILRALDAHVAENNSSTS